MEKNHEQEKNFLKEFLKVSTYRDALLLLLDALLVFSAFLAAYELRFEGNIPEVHMMVFWNLVPWLLGCRVLAVIVSQLHRWSFRYAGFHDGIRVVSGMVLGSFMFLASVMLFGLYRPMRSVVVLEFFIASVLLGGYRFAPRLISFLYLERERAKRKGIRKTIIVGAGSSGELLLRDLRRSEEHDYRVVGFVDDDKAKVGRIVSGHKVLGTLEELSRIAGQHSVSDILIAIPMLEPKKVKAILDMCQDRKLRYKILPVSFAYLQEKVSASMLQDLQPEDLLPRDSVPFEESEIKALVEGKTALVTGAAGSIGSEMARQLAKYGSRRLVLVDMNENDLYFLYRDLREQYPSMELHPEVADVRDREKMLRLGGKYSPESVVHAAAHKHVPLMEIAPEEAVKNNVFGTMNTADMAIESGAEKFVFISTDKAVKPSSVMGVTKRVAEFVVREKAKQGRTHFSAVRFGNVLGSAGSVVPLFKKQIAKGGPVTVTHPDMKRYFMTIEEAVGLVLLAGLGKYGNLCILDMGEQIKILDLARHMILMAGLVPDQDIKIVFTGLRPGEKMQEELMTEEEEKTQKAREKIFVVKTSFIPEDLGRMLDELSRAAAGEDAAKIRAMLKTLVPRYTVDGNGDGSKASY